MTLSNYLPKALPSNTITLWDIAATYDWGAREDTNIQCTTHGHSLLNSVLEDKMMTNRSLDICSPLEPRILEAHFCPLTKMLM